MTRIKRQVIKDRMSADEIIAIIRSDIDRNFRITLDRKLHQERVRMHRRMMEQGTTNCKAEPVEMIGKSGQTYRFVIVNCVVDGIVSSMYRLFLYFTVPCDYGIAYYTVSYDDDCDIFNIQDGKTHINRFSPHVVHRYIERHGGVDYGERGFIDMNISNSMLDPVEDENGNLIAITAHGSFIGKVVNGVQRYNTFYHDSISLTKSNMRNAVKETTIRKDGIYSKMQNSIDQYIYLYEHNLVSKHELLQHIDNELINADDDFYTYYGCSEKELRDRIGRLVSKDALCADKTNRDTHLETGKRKLCVSSCLQGIQERMPADTGIWFSVSNNRIRQSS